MLHIPALLDLEFQALTEHNDTFLYCSSLYLSILNPNPISHPLSQLRSSLRMARRTIPHGLRFKYHIHIKHNILRAGILKHKHIALYLPFDGEVDTTILLPLLKQCRKSCYIPILSDEKLRFVALTGRCIYNKYGIKEPLYPKRISTKRITLLLTPLVGFDIEGNRLGMGKGYYDKTLAFLRTRSTYTLPKRWGIAYQKQQTKLTPNSWDVPLSKMITERHIHTIR